MGKKLYDGMVAELESSLNGMVLDLVSFEDGEKENESGIELFTRVELEIPRKNGTLSRCRFSCKLPRVMLPFTEDALDAGISVMIEDLRVTFISANKEIYTRGSSLRIIEQEEI